MAAKSTYRCSSLIAGNSSAPTRVTVARHSSDTSSTFALSTDVSRPRRSAAARNATRATRSISAAVYRKVFTALSRSSARGSP